MIPYGRQTITEEDVLAVTSALRSDWLTQGPKIPEFEQLLAQTCGVREAVSMANGTAALHAACAALGLGTGDYLWTSPISFVASANCARFLGAQVDFVDIDSETRNICPQALEQKLRDAKITGRLPKIIVVVHFAGNPCEMAPIAELAGEYGFLIIEDAAHAIGSTYNGLPIGSSQYSAATCFSFHPVKNLTTGEGGAVTTNNCGIAQKIRTFCTHGITKNPLEFSVSTDEPWRYEQQSLGFNYRLTDLQAALGISQLQKLTEFTARRQLLVERYINAMQDLPLQLPQHRPYTSVAWHIFAISVLDTSARLDLYNYLRAANIGVNVHYIPIHLQPYYRTLGFKPGDFPNAEAYYAGAITLPLFPALSFDEQDYIVTKVRAFLCA